MKWVISLLLLVISISCAPTENITAIKEQAYQTGYNQGHTDGLNEAKQENINTVTTTTGGYYNSWEAPPNRNNYQDGYSAGIQQGAEDCRRNCNPWPRMSQ